MGNETTLIFYLIDSAEKRKTKSHKLHRVFYLENLLIGILLHST